MGRYALSMAMEELGRRERKKLQTRQVISDVATTLFMERGFDQVTVAEVAKAADVAVQTVFNHFPTKEDLLFDEQRWWVGPGQVIRELPGGVGMVEVVEALEGHYLSVIRGRLRSGHLVTWKAFSRTIDESPALRARRRRNAEEMEALIVAALREREYRGALELSGGSGVEASGRSEVEAGGRLGVEVSPQSSPLMARLIAAQYAAAQKVLEEELGRVLPEKPNGVQIAQAEEELERAVRVVFGTLKRGLQH
ncbi:helix-turn-helix domain-containing protein [Kribbella sp. NPDC056861]|uniref:TetR/AcrR family transcriptional regulator n=1 Tax=Kribbella sp. NPDC056861 TaxID=3154857 RepID=UPI003421AEC8